VVQSTRRPSKIRTAVRTCLPRPSRGRVESPHHWVPGAILAAARLSEGPTVPQGSLPWREGAERIGLTGLLEDGLPSLRSLAVMRPEEAKTTRFLSPPAFSSG
jgi:hypothetical protein